MELSKEQLEEAKKSFDIASTLDKLGERYAAYFWPADLVDQEAPINTPDIFSETKVDDSKRNFQDITSIKLEWTCPRCMKECGSELGLHKHLYIEIKELSKKFYDCNVRTTDNEEMVESLNAMIDTSDSDLERGLLNNYEMIKK